MKKFLILLLIFLGALIFLIAFCNEVVLQTAKGKVISHKKERVGVVLGTAKYVYGRKENLFYKYRIQKVFELYRKGQIKFIVVSGDNSHDGYDEPTQMKADLIKLGVPANKIFCDYAGFSTLDSMLRMKHVFKLKRIVVISQQFHVERALYIANRSGLKAVGAYAKDVPHWYAPYNKYREKLARVKAVIEILLETEPKFKGVPIQIK